MTTVLGIDAAWTPHHPSGVALLSNMTGHWRATAVAPSYKQFIDLADNKPVDWNGPEPPGTAPDPAALLAASRRLAGGASVDVVAVDMPLATVAITVRRKADDVISRMFGARGCAVHTPSASRPGAIGTMLRDGFVAAGFALGTTKTSAGTASRLLEVYPHPALLALTGAMYRLPYKVSRVRAYRRSGETVDDGWKNLRATWRKILAALRTQIDEVPTVLDEAADDARDVRGVRLKRYEDAIDGLVCGWVGIRYLAGDAIGHGDDTAAIWCPPVARPGELGPLMGT